MDLALDFNFQDYSFWLASDMSEAAWSETSYANPLVCFIAWCYELPPPVFTLILEDARPRLLYRQSGTQDEIGFVDLPGWVWPLARIYVKYPPVPPTDAVLVSREQALAHVRRTCLKDDDCDPQQMRDA